MIRIGSLFSGVDGLALGVQMRTLARVAWHAEIDPGDGLMVRLGVAA
jgi:site-specific DNA-cytosine methylase